MVRALKFLGTAALLVVTWALTGAPPARADGSIDKVKHIIVVMQENHSFDNYFGVLPYIAGSPYHPAGASRSCAAGDSTCVDGLACTVGKSGALTCTDSNLDLKGDVITPFHESTRCVGPDLDHDWQPTHQEVNYNDPNATLASPLDDGFVRVNQLAEPGGTPYGTMGYFDNADIPGYYRLAEDFAISDRHFSSTLGPTIPNRFYLMAGTSFGHLTTDDSVPPLVGYKPINGTIFDLLDKYHVSWADYFEDLPQSTEFDPVDLEHQQQIALLYLTLAGTPLTSLPQVSFVDPDFGVEGYALEDDEHPPTDIQRGQEHVTHIANALRYGPYWKDTVLFITYDEHGGFFDHAAPPAAPQSLVRTPDGVFPGQCEDLSDPPRSEQPGGGAECSSNDVSTTDTSVLDAEALCPALAADPTGPYPADCAAFDQLGVRVPFIAVSPFSKPHFVSHVVGDHDSILAFIEKRFMTQADGTVPHLTGRDAAASDTEDMFDFTNAPSKSVAIAETPAPAHDCTPAGGGGGSLIAQHGRMFQGMQAETPSAR
jgi:phospholipase C